MISSVGYKKVKIHITTFQKEDSVNQSRNKMDKEKCLGHTSESNKRFVCSTCLNSNNSYNNNAFCGRIAKPCPICRKAYERTNEKKTDNTHIQHDRKDTVFYTYDHSTPYNANNKPKDKLGCGLKTYNDLNVDRNKNSPRGNKTKTDNRNTKIVQTSQTDLTQDLSLLKEVLTVFQSKKQIDIKQNNSKTVVMKDVSVATESQSKAELIPKLTKSRIFQLSIDDCCNNNAGNNFKIVNSSQPNNPKSSHLSIDLSKQKSSSIPQMKLEELKHSLKEKTKSKDAIEEVNRMFATVRRHEMSKIIDEHNRPLTRNGPRVLPVVKTNNFKNNTKDNSDSEMEKTNKEEATCKCCQTNNLQLSAGDSFVKHECCYHKMLHEGKCEKCVYMLCCHYQNHSKIETGALVCEHCRHTSNTRHESINDHHCDNTF